MMKVKNYFSMEKPATLIVTLRMAILAVALAVASWKGLRAELTSQNPVFFTLAGLFTANLFLLIPFRKSEPPAWMVMLQLSLDTILVSFVILLTGGLSSPFGYLYLPVIFITGIALGTLPSLAIGGISVVSHGTMLIIASYFNNHQDSYSLITLNTSVLLFAAGAVIILTKLIRNWIEQTLTSVEEKTLENADLTKKAEESHAKLSVLEESIRKQEAFARRIAEHSADLSSLGEAENFFRSESLIMRKVFSIVEKVASSDATVLIQGESGTGKEKIARAIHHLGDRSSKPFIPVNCGAIPSELIESELFGHKKGSFTGAISDNPGLVRSSNGGTLFLDEIGDLPLSMQVKLLRVLQEKSVRPVGSSDDISVDVRIIAATHRNIKERVRTGEFREDLFYRLNVVQLTLPPLRERREDIPLIIKQIANKFLPAGQELVMSPAAKEKLLHYGYPGNIRELENILERAWVLGGGAVLPEHVPGEESSNQVASDNSSIRKTTQIIEAEEVEFPCKLDDLLGVVEKHYLKLSLEKADTKKEAASLLGMNFRSFRYRLEKFGIDAGED